MDIRRIDLNLLIAFDALMLTRNVSQAALLMHVGQSAMSHSLKRLREIIDDPILVRVSNGMEPTARALELTEPIRTALADLQNALSPPPEFLPEQAENRFHLIASDYIAFVLVPALIENVKQRAPKISLVIHPPSAASIEAQMEKGKIDLVLDFERTLKDSGRLHRHSLFTEHLMVLLRNSHPALKRNLTIKRYLALDHLLVSTTEKETGIVDDNLLAGGLTRSINLVIPHFLAAPLIVKRSDMAVTLPSRIAKEFASMTDLKAIDIPMALPSYNVEMAWHPLRDRAPAHVWLRSMILKAAGSLSS